MPLQGTPTLALLDEDAELAAAIAPADLEHARRVVRVPSLTLEVGACNVAEAAPEPSLGLLVLEGVVTVNVALCDRVASQLAGPGDILHRTGVPDALVPAAVDHFVSERAHLAVLDARFIAAIRHWPSLLLALHERLRVQEERLGVLAALGKLRHVDDRLLALLWHLAERWGRVTHEGVVVPLALTHETLGRLAGAERPTITLALQELARRGEVRRREDGAFVLREETRDRLLPEADSRPRGRPLAVARTVHGIDAPEAAPSKIDREALGRRMAAMHESMPDRTRDVQELLEPPPADAEADAELRERVAAERADRTA